MNSLSKHQIEFCSQKNKCLNAFVLKPQVVTLILTPPKELMKNGILQTYISTRKSLSLTKKKRLKM